jgi:chromosome segregation ATPase
MVIEGMGAGFDNAKTGGRVTTNPPTLKRTLFGYGPEAVRKLLSDRDAMFSQAQDRLREKDEELALVRAELDEARSQFQRAAEGARSTEQKNARLQSELEGALTQLTKQTDGTRAAEARANQLEAEARSLREQLQLRDEASSAAAPSASQELSSVLDMVEKGFRRLIGQARTRTQAQLEEVATARRELDEKVERFSAWRDHVVALIRSVREAVVRARAHAQQVPERVRAALGPTTDAMTSVHDAMAELIRATEGHDPAQSPARSAGTIPLPTTDPQHRTEPETRPEDANGEGLPRDFGLQ